MSEPIFVPNVTVGIDLSLTSTAVGTLDLSSGEVVLNRVRSSGSKDASLSEKLARYRRLASDITEQVVKVKPLAVAIEGAQFSTSKDTSAHRRAGLWWHTVNLIASEGIAILEVPPTTLKKWATGKGNAGKDMMVAAGARRWANVAQNDEADAAWLADLVAYCLGEPTSTLVSRTKARDAVISKLDIFDLGSFKSSS